MKEKYIYRQAKAEGREGLSNQEGLNQPTGSQQAKRKTSREGGRKRREASSPLKGQISGTQGRGRVWGGLGVCGTTSPHPGDKEVDSPSSKVTSSGSCGRFVGTVRAPRTLLPHL